MKINTQVKQSLSTRLVVGSLVLLLSMGVGVGWYMGAFTALMSLSQTQSTDTDGDGVDDNIDIDDDNDGIPDEEEGGVTSNCLVGFFQVIDDVLHVLDPDNGSYIPIGPPTGFRYNGIGYNPDDGLLYGYARKSGTDKNGASIVSGDIISIDPSNGEAEFVINSGSSSNVAAGDVYDGVYYFKRNNRIDGYNIATGVISTAANAPFSPNDLSIIDGVVYGLDGDKLSRIDLTATTPTLTTVTVSGGVQNGIFGASYVSQNNRLYFSNNNGGLWEIKDYTSANPTGVYVINTSKTNYNDGAACPSSSFDLVDTDGDGIIDSRDLDADNDGILDIVEAGGTDTDGDGRLDDNTDTDGDGLADIYDNDDTDGPTGTNPCSPLFTCINTGSTSLLMDTDGDGTIDNDLDYEGDGIPNMRDSDSDGDGCGDAEEGGGNFSLASGTVLNDTLTGGVDANGVPVIAGSTGQSVGFSYDENVLACSFPVSVDTDGDGIDDNIDLDDDNDGIPDEQEGGETTNCMVGFFQVISGQLYLLNPDNGTYTPIGPNAGFPYNSIGYNPDDGMLYGTTLQQGTDVNGTSVVEGDIIKIDPNSGEFQFIVFGGEDKGSAAGDVYQGIYYYKTYPGISSYNIATGVISEITDINFLPVDFSIIDGIAYGLRYQDLYVIDIMAASPTLTLVPVPEVPSDRSYGASYVGQNNRLYFSNNDGGMWEIKNYTTSTPTATYVINTTPTYANDGASCPSSSFDFIDTDGDGIEDSKDLDSDNDGIPDIVEAGGADTNGDGRADDSSDADGDGLADIYDNDDTDGPAGSNTCSPLFTCLNMGSTSLLMDTDGDGSIDNDLDFDGDGVPNNLDLDSDNDGILDILENNLSGLDTNADGQVDDALTNDSDGNGWSNSTDGGNGGTSPLLTTDANSDGVADAYPTQNSDNDATPNFLDIDSDNDGITDNTEAQDTDTYLSPTNLDDDRDGIDDAYDNDDSQFGGPSSGISPVNTDGLDSMDYLDTDSDEDGIVDEIEGHDTNTDGVVNNDDTPSANTGQSGGTTDVDGDGLLDGYDNDTSSPDPTNGGLGPEDHPDTMGPTAEQNWREEPGNLFPVEWLAFDGKQEGNTVILDWITATEMNSDFFSLERSLNGITFSQVGREKAAGDTQTPTAYRYVDAALPAVRPERLLYRLRQVDIDGQFSYSNTIELAFTQGDVFSSLKVGPNPASDIVRVRYTLENAQPSSLIVYSLKGQKMYEKVLDRAAGEETTINVSSWSEGIYIVSLSGKNVKPVKLQVRH